MYSLHGMTLDTTVLNALNIRNALTGLYAFEKQLCTNFSIGDKLFEQLNICGCWKSIAKVF